MEATATATTAPPCARCGTTGGYTHPNCDTPRRFDGSRFGFTSEICNTCYARAYRQHCRETKRKRVEHFKALAAKRVANQVAKRAAEAAVKASAAAAIQTSKVQRLIRCAAVVAEATACDLCGLGRGRHDGSAFDLEGWICAECRDELKVERDMKAHRSRRVSFHRLDCSQPRLGNRADGYLIVLTPGFRECDLTTRAACRALVAGTRRIFQGRAAS